MIAVLDLGYGIGNMIRQFAPACGIDIFFCESSQKLGIDRV